MDASVSSSSSTPKVTKLAAIESGDNSSKDSKVVGRGGGRGGGGGGGGIKSEKRPIIFQKVIPLKNKRRAFSMRTIAPMWKEEGEQEQRRQ